MKNAVICRLPSPRCKTKCGWKWQGMGLQGKERKMFGKGIPTVERRRDGKRRIIKFISTSQQWASTTPKPKKDVINPSDRTSISRFSMLTWSAFAERILTTVHDFAVKLAIFSRGLNLGPPQPEGKPLPHPSQHCSRLCAEASPPMVRPSISTKDWRLCPDSFNCIIAAI